MFSDVDRGEQVSRSGRRHSGGLPLLSLLAILLITCSHVSSGGLLPVEDYFSGLGNALFFGLWGYGVATSESRKWHFARWAAHRLRRLYLPALIVTVGGLLAARPTWVGSAEQALKVLVFPTPYWFIGALLAYHMLAYPILRTRSAGVAVAAAAVAAIPYAFVYVALMDISVWSIEGSGFIRYVFYWQTMMVGMAMGLSRKRRDVARPETTVLLFALLGAYVGGWYALGSAVGYEWQFAIHVLTLPILALAIRVGESDSWLAVPMRLPLGKAIAFVAGLTLEIYLVQYSVYSSPQIAALVFPANVLVFALGSLLAAWLVHRLSDFVCHAFSVRGGGSGF